MEVEMNKDGGGWERRRRWRGFKAPAMGEQWRRNRGLGSVGDDERIILVRKKNGMLARGSWTRGRERTGARRHGGTQRHASRDRPGGWERRDPPSER
jgi:hypothetical protein